MRVVFVKARAKRLIKVRFFQPQPTDPDFIGSPTSQSTLQDLTLADRDAGGNTGGAILSSHDLMLDNVVVTSSVAQSGGGIRASGKLTIQNGSRVIGNNSHVNGGAIIGTGSTELRIIDSTIAGNTASNVGGAIYALGDVEITNSTISDNEAASSGGGLYFAGTGSIVSIAGSTFANNVSTGGGSGIQFTGTLTSSLSLFHTTVSRNRNLNSTATGAGGINATGGTFNATNSVIAGNRHLQGSNDDLSGTINGTNIGNFIGGDPKLGSLSDNGGPTLTMIPLLDSPLIDAGSHLVSLPQLDQRGFLRKFDGDGQSPAAVNIGAVEFGSQGRAFIVDDSGDSDDSNPGDGVCDSILGLCTLLAEITETNALPNESPVSPDVIAFELGLTVNLISPQTNLPPITDSVVIDGTSQPGYAGIPRVEIDGGGTAATGIMINSEDVIVKGLSVTGFTDAGVRIASSGRAILRENYLGINPSNQSDPNDFGVKVFSSNNVIDGNLISGNTKSGVYIAGASASNNSFVNNWIGLDNSSSLARPNGRDGITNLAAGTMIGLPLAPNVISGNLEQGIEITSAAATENEVYGNYIGLDSSGTSDLGNGDAGVRIISAANNFVGGIGFGDGNVISGNDNAGVVLSMSGTSANQVAGNRIGTDFRGLIAVGNSNQGVRISSSASANEIFNNQIAANALAAVSTDQLLSTSGNEIVSNIIGIQSSFAGPMHNGPGGAINIRAPQTTVEDNTISSVDAGIFLSGNATDALISDNLIGVSPFNQANNLGMSSGIKLGAGSADALVRFNEIANNNKGVLVVGGNGHAILSNTIHDNSLIGIDLAGNGPTANDPGDADTGPNNLQNYPVINSALLSGTTFTINYSVPSTTQASAYPLLIQFYRGDGNGQGEETVISDSYTSQVSQSNETLIAQNITNVVIGDEIVATATDANGNTSEFSLPVFVTAGANLQQALAEDTTASTKTSAMQTDVNGDNQTTALDALEVINALSEPTIAEQGVRTNRDHTDIDGDGVTSAKDALLIINFIADSRTSDQASRDEQLNSSWAKLVDDALENELLF